MVFTVAVAPTALAAESAVDYDYSREGSYFNTVFTSADILEYIGYSLSDGERAYLNEYGALNVKYETVTAQQISVTTIDEVTRITARPYTYVGANGSSVVWTPISASIEGTEVDFVLSDGAYVADFDGVYGDSAAYVKFNN